MNQANEIGIKPVSEALGAEVSGVDLSSPLGAREMEELRAAFARYGVLFFRDQTLSPEKWRAMKWRLFELHFQYLNAFDRPGDYDYFQITAGPLSLASRYAGRPPSASRIDVAVSKFTSTTP